MSKRLWYHLQIWTPAARSSFLSCINPARIIILKNLKILENTEVESISSRAVGLGRATLLNQFHATGLFLYPLKTSENLWFSDVFGGYRKRTVV